MTRIFLFGTRISPIARIFVRGVALTVFLNTNNSDNTNSYLAHGSHRYHGCLFALGRSLSPYNGQPFISIHASPLWGCLTNQTLQIILIKLRLIVYQFHQDFITADIMSCWSNHNNAYINRLENVGGTFLMPSSAFMPSPAFVPSSAFMPSSAFILSSARKLWGCSRW